MVPRVDIRPCRDTISPLNKDSLQSLTDVVERCFAAAIILEGQRRGIKVYHEPDDIQLLADPVALYLQENESNGDKSSVPPEEKKKLTRPDFRVVLRNSHLYVEVTHDYHPGKSLHKRGQQRVMEKAGLGHRYIQLSIADIEGHIDRGTLVSYLLQLLTNIANETVESVA